MRSRKPIRHGQMPADVMAVKTSREKAMPTIFEALIEIITNTFKTEDTIILIITL